MKIAITGHADGLGQAIAKEAPRHGYEVVGFSLENDFDITQRESRLVMVPEIIKCDVFVNCAYSRQVNDLSQCHLLTAVYGEWQNTSKHIINIGSVAPDWKKADYDFGRIIYRGAKGALDTISDEVSMSGKCRVTNIRPDWMESAELTRIEEFHQRKAKNPLTYEQVTALIYNIIQMAKAGVTLTSVSLRGTRT